jgi:hypothetical protein
MTWSVHTVAQENVSATLTVAVPAARVFAVLADPTAHSAIDGTGWVQEAADRAPLTEVGQISGSTCITPAIQTVTTRWPTRSWCSTRRAPLAGCRDGEGRRSPGVRRLDLALRPGAARPVRD